MRARWKIVVFAVMKGKKMFCMISPHSSLSLHCVAAWWFRFERWIVLAKILCGNFWMNEDPFTLFASRSTICGINDSFLIFLSHTPYIDVHLPSQRKAKLFFTFTLFYVDLFCALSAFWISKRIFLCVFIHCHREKKKLENENEYEFSSSSFSHHFFARSFVRIAKKKVFFCLNSNGARREDISLTRARRLDVGAVSRYCELHIC